MLREECIALNTYIRREVSSPNLSFYFKKQANKINKKPKHAGEKK